MTAVNDKPTIVYSRAPARLLRHRTAQVGYIALALLVVGLLPAVLVLPAPWVALGLGLLFPGAGLIYTADPIVAVLVVVAFTFTVTRLITRGNYVSPAFVWLAGAGLAALLAGGEVWSWAVWAVPATLVAAVLIISIVLRSKRRVAHRQREHRAEIVASSPRRVVAAQPESDDELTPDELAFHRWMLDHALRPQEDWSSFDVRDQYTLKSLRYQVNFLQWSLALAQSSRTSAFSGYANLAQRNLIERATQRHVWAYWRRENILGNLRGSADPIEFENVMFSGYLGLMLGAYTNTTGDRRFDKPGALTFAYDDSRTYSYTHGQVLDAIEDNLDRSAWGLYACEPGLVFPLCNAVAMLGLGAADANGGRPGFASRRDRFLAGLEDEFTHPNGDTRPFLMTRFGVTLPGHSAHVNAQMGFFLNPIAPQMAERWWTTAYDEIIKPGLYLPDRLPGREDPVMGDWGTGKPSHAQRYMALLALSRELGDHETYTNVLEAADEALGWSVRDGVGCYESISLNANALMGMARFGGTGAFRKLITNPSHTAGPKLADADYPAVLVARATSDGEALHLVLRPGAGDGRVSLHLEGLRPGVTYDTEGAIEQTLVANHDGRAIICADLTGRTPIWICPQA